MSTKIRQSEQVAKDLLSMVNSFSVDPEAFVDTITKDHRTLQQSAFRLFLACIEKWAEFDHTNNYDLRNEQTVKVCSEIVKMMKEKEIGFIPMI